MDGSIYAIHSSKSTAQQQYTQARLAALAEERKRRTLASVESQLERTVSTSSSMPGGSVPRHHRDNSHGSMDQAKLPTTSSSNSSSQSEIAHHGLLSKPYELRHGRRYLRELPYPLPVDLAELQRQNLRTLLCCKVFGRTVCSPGINKAVPQRVLELGCGSGYWSSMCHDYFSSLGYRNVSFTGVDVAPLAPNLTKQGLNWRFVQHDLRRIPYPFDDEQFDLVILKDLSLILPLGMASQKLIDESIRLLKEGGTLEIWESDHVLRSLQPHSPTPSKEPRHQDNAARTGTFLISPSTPFAPAQNKFLQQANSWIQLALDLKRLPPTPCARVAPILYQEPDYLDDIGSRRVAIPLGELRWERDEPKHSRDPKYPRDSVMSKGKGRAMSQSLSADQAALRQTALLTVVNMIESLEPLLKEVSGKNSEEWSHWWAMMMASLMDPSKAALTGECLEVGAWWATKLADD